MPIGWLMPEFRTRRDLKCRVQDLQGSRVGQRTRARQGAGYEHSREPPATFHLKTSSARDDTYARRKAVVQACFPLTMRLFRGGFPDPRRVQFRFVKVLTDSGLGPRAET